LWYFLANFIIPELGHGEIVLVIRATNPIYTNGDKMWSMRNGFISIIGAINVS
jgi:hypothetical protein